MFGFKSKVTGGINKFSGRTDFLEAVCASAALVAFADGDISDVEVATTSMTVKNNPNLAKGFKPAKIEKCIDSMLKRAQAGKSGRMGLYKEIDDITENDEMCEAVYLTALDVAEGDGEVCEKEKAVLSRIAGRLGVNPSNFDV